MTTEVLDTETVEAALEAYRGGEWGADAVQYKNSINNDTCIVYDFNWNAVSVRAPELLHYKDKGFMMATPSMVLGGTAVDGGVTEAQIVAGGQTITITLTDGEWVDGDDFADLRQAFIDGLFGSVEGGTGFTAQVAAAMAVGDVVRTSATVVTITLPAAASYSISGDETVTVLVDLEVGIKHPNGPGLFAGSLEDTFVVTNA